MYALQPFVLLPSLFALSACSGLPNLSAPDAVLFSHSDPAHVAAPVHRNTWSPSQWNQVAALKEPNQPPQVAASRQEMVLYFDTNADQLMSSELDRLSAFMSQANPFPGRRFLLVGHTDSRHTSNYNQSLSERRAATVFRLLLGYGVDQRNITTQARGLQEPATSNESEMGRAKNRRVTLSIVD
ncbi:OmpA family protein [Rhodoferax sp.]|uniref:OmpA family protein n=1 Tax=Rhodoferax sp. TaxID=50421 RepID=UPI0025ED426D|nr:OmpA family protein [Rhodoferax sp.]